MKDITDKSSVHSIQVRASTHQTLQALKEESGVPITRLIDRAVNGLVIARKKQPKILG